MTSSIFGEAEHRPTTAPERAGILHLGLGNFHRAHQAVYTAAAIDAEGGPWGIVGAASRSRRVVDPMREQDNRYTVLTLSPDATQAEVMNVHVDTLVAAEEPERLDGFFADEGIRIVTITVSENGYSYSHSHAGLDVSSPQVQADLAGEVPVTVIGQIVRGLRARLRAGGAPCAIVSCDNMNENGKLVQSLVTQFIQRSEAPDAEELLQWIGTSVTFPSTMVDRIVPATEDRHRDISKELTGSRDQVPVPAEPFSMWVLEDNFPAGRPAWERGGAIFTDDVSGYELLKLRILNASNSMLAYLGLLSGNMYIAQGLNDNPRFRRVVEQMMRQEMLPTFTVPDGIDIDQYVDELFGRFGNLAVGHRTSQVGSDGSTKLPVRITEPVLLHARDGRTPGAIALLAAAYLRTFCDADAYSAEVTGRPEDPRADLLAEAGRTHEAPEDLVRAVIGESGIFSADLAQVTAWTDRVTELLSVLRSNGVDAAIDAALD